MDKEHYSASHAIELAKGKWDYVIAKLYNQNFTDLINPKKHFPCPVHGGKDGFRVFPDFLETGGCICNTCGSRSNGLSTLMWLLNQDYNTVIRSVVDLFEAPPKYQKKEAKSPVYNEKATRMWHVCHDITYGDLASRYFASRGIMCIGRPGKNLNYGLKFLENAMVKTANGLENYSAIIGAIRDNQGKVLNVHKTFLDPEGNGKAKIENNKRLASLPEGCRMAGGAIYFQEIDSIKDIMIVGEGIETVLSAWFHYGCEIPAASLISATMMPKWEPPKSVKTVFIFADKDIPDPITKVSVGREAAIALGKKLREKGIHGGILLPEGPESKEDWNDALMLGEKFPELFSYDASKAPDVNDL